MYDFTKLIELLNQNDNLYKEALNLVKADFHLGKIEAINKKTSHEDSYIIDNNYDKNIIVSYSTDEYNYNLYKNSDNYIYTENELNDLQLLIKILALFYKDYILYKKRIESELLSFNTKLYNAHGFLTKIDELSNKINMKEYNSYFINLKGFGLINKTYGNKVGDQSIIYYATKLKSFIQDNELVAHPGGDNFVALIKRERHQDFIDLASKMNVDIDGYSFILTGIIGYVEIDDNFDNYREMLTKSSVACQYARATSKHICKMTDELFNNINSTKNIEKSFKDELEKGNFIVYYQPKFDVSTGRIVGVEALSRWVNEGKVVSPFVFVPILEKNGDIIDLDLHVLENLCSDIHNFRNLGHKIVPASCNLSRKDFEDPDLEKKVINIIKKYNVKTEDIVIEVTETTNLEENERLAKFINEMSKNGIMTSIDDFGTGYSSLSVLRDFKVREIKIDRSFINRDKLTKSDEIIIGSIINMATELEIAVICEGVETEAQIEFLKKLGCFRVQGYYYSKPLPKEEFEALLIQNRKMLNDE